MMIIITSIRLLLIEGESNEVIYDLDFDQIGRLIQVKIGSNSILTNTYYKDGVLKLTYRVLQFIKMVLSIILNIIIMIDLN